MMDELLQQFVILWAVIDPIGSIPVFLALVGTTASVERRKLAVIATAVAGLVLLFFIVAGQFLLEAMQIPLSAFQVAGGIVLFLFALTMIFGESKPEEELHFCENAKDLAIFPLAIPSIASPGAMMAVVLLTDNHRFSIPDQIITSGIMLAVVAITLALLLAATSIQKLIGQSGASIISRVMGLILASVAANNVLAGIRDYFLLPVQ